MCPVDITKDFVRIRQKEPSLFDKKSFRTVDVGKKGFTKVIVACPKRKFDVKKKRCKVGLQVQSILLSRKDFTKKQLKQKIKGLMRN